MSIGQNTIAAKELLAFVERIERIDAEKKELTADRAAVVAEAKAQGYSPAGLAYCVKVRAMKPHDWQEAEAIRETYLHAIGLGEAPPLFRLMGMLDVDVASRESVLAALEKIVPASGDVILRIGSDPTRLWRDRDGLVRREPWVAPAAAPRGGEGGERPAGRSRRPKAAEVMPEVDEAGAYELGRAFFRDNRSVIENPFPFGDPRRARFDEGWRAEGGGDGMGPSE